MQVSHCHRRSFNIPGQAHELTFSCYQRYKFLTRDRTCEWLARAINNAREALDFSVWAYVFMPEHVHLIVHPRKRDYQISALLRQIKQPVSRLAMRYLERDAPHWLPRVTRSRGKRSERLFWQSGGGYDRNIETMETLTSMIKYVHANPVRRGLVTETIDWPWSSARWYAQLGEGPVPIDPIE